MGKRLVKRHRKMIRVALGKQAEATDRALKQRAIVFGRRFEVHGAMDVGKVGD